jgi:predicted RNA-binding Zn-ribbon protein involved in translation (DUF1610 family)
MKICQNCKTENPDDNLFCMSCGNKISEEKQADATAKKCPKCGINNLAESRFCASCGAKFKEEQKMEISSDGVLRLKKLIIEDDDGNERAFIGFDERNNLCLSMCNENKERGINIVLIDGKCDDKTQKIYSYKENTVLIAIDEEGSYIVA